jgi:hypothetical protein
MGVGCPVLFLIITKASPEPRRAVAHPAPKRMLLGRSVDSSICTDKNSLLSVESNGRMGKGFYGCVVNVNYMFYVQK